MAASGHLGGDAEAVAAGRNDPVCDQYPIGTGCRAHRIGHQPIDAAGIAGRSAAGAARDSKRPECGAGAGEHQPRHVERATAAGSDSVAAGWLGMAPGAEQQGSAHRPDLSARCRRHGSRNAAPARYEPVAGRAECAASAAGWLQIGLCAAIPACCGGSASWAAANALSACNTVSATGHDSRHAQDADPGRHYLRPAGADGADVADPAAMAATGYLAIVLCPDLPGSRRGTAARTGVMGSNPIAAQCPAGHVAVGMGSAAADHPAADGIPCLAPAAGVELAGTGYQQRARRNR